MITGDQSKAARELLGWSTKRLADEAALSIKTLEAFEQGKPPLVIVHRLFCGKYLNAPARTLSRASQ
jgi:transcriptional regulator with XRE-family HTH domain